MNRALRVSLREARKAQNGVNQLSARDEAISESELEIASSAQTASSQ